ncbi:MAG TPA: pyridoxamine 5'-phosphate oxidase family protein [Bacillota bacterium]|nr:pyridoxamine 5'-phosphate oxidase family protein [Bacillota bacterium]
MRLEENQLSKEEATEILEGNTNGVLALDGDGGYTYAVPLSYAYSDGKLFFHGAKEGHKLDAIKRNARVSFCVVGQDKIIPSEFNSLFLSVIVFGEIRVLEGDAERQHALEVILRKYSPDFMEGGRKYIKAQWDNVMVAELRIEHMTGKKGV